MSLMRATVVDDKDPEHRGRVRLCIPDLFLDPITNEVISSPWCEAKGGGLHGVGELDVPEIGSPVFVKSVYSSDGGVYNLVYERGTHGASADGSHVPAVGRGVDDESVTLKVSAPFQVPAAVTGLRKVTPQGLERRPANNEKLDLKIPTSANAGEYPRNKVTKTVGGFVTEMDNTRGQERLQLHHPSGASLEVNASGTLTQRFAKRWEEVLEHDTGRTGGDERRRVDGHVLRSEGGNRVEETAGRRVILASELNLQARFDLLMDFGGRAQLKSKGPIELRSLGDVRILGAGNFRAGGAAGATLSSALGDVTLATASPTGRIRAHAMGGMDVTPTGLPGQPVALAEPLLAFVASLMTHVALVSAAAATATPNPLIADSMAELVGVVAGLSALTIAPHLRSTTAVGV